MALVASGFLLRVLGGAAATHVPVSIWFLLVCSLGARRGHRQAVTELTAWARTRCGTAR